MPKLRREKAVASPYAAINIPEKIMRHRLALLVLLLSVSVAQAEDFFASSQLREACGGQPALVSGMRPAGSTSTLSTGS
jgi:hypothetical protein